MNKKEWVPEIKWVNPESLTPYENNAKIHTSEQIDELSKIIAEFGFNQPIVVDKNNIVVAGHGRREAAIKMRMPLVPVVIADHLNENQVRAARIADNKLASTEYDDDRLSFDIGTLDRANFDMSLTGIDLDSIEEMLKRGDVGVGGVIGGSSYVEGEDDLPEDLIVRAKRGQIYQMGEHRLMCGDSTDRATVDRLMNGVRADMVFTSPPYNISKNGFEKKGKYDNDSDNKKYFASFLQEFLETWREVSRYQFINLQFLAANKVDKLVWLYKNRDFFIDVICCPKDTTLPAMEKNILNSDFELVYVFGETGRTRHIKIGKEFRGTVPNIFEMKRNRKKVSETHRAGFDVSFPESFITKLAGEKIVVADPFGGTGTTMIACEKTDRKCFMMELDPHYCDVIIKRWEEFTGKTAVLLSSEPSSQTQDHHQEKSSKKDARQKTSGSLRRLVLVSDQKGDGGRRDSQRRKIRSK